MKDESILDPVDQYPRLKETVGKKAGDFFDSLAKQAGTDVKANQETCRELAKQSKILDQERQALEGKKGTKAFFIVLSVIMIVVGVILAIVGIYKAMQGDSWSWLFILIGVLLLGGGITLLVTQNKRLGKQIAALESKVHDLEQKVAKLLAEAKAQMAGLNGLFDWGMPAKIISEAVPLLQVDQNFDIRKYSYMVEKYGLKRAFGNNTSVYFVQSGSIIGNPFLVERLYKHKMVNKVYTGSLFITWTTTVRTKDGYQTVTHSETLTASVTEPAPDYHFETFLVYANEAAPDLSFSRRPQVSISASEKDIARQVKAAMKQADKLEKESLMDNDTHDFTKMINDEFEALFHAWDRDHEQQFRLLFTPLAQENMVEILKSKKPFGDDFSFAKAGKINVIGSAHAQSADLYADPTSFAGYDHDNMRSYFVSYVLKFFESIYWDLAPLLAIPLYQQHKPSEYIYDHPFECNVSSYEHEVAANGIPDEYLVPEDCDTETIRKARFKGKVGEADLVEVTAYGYHGEDRTSFVGVMGGDGRVHDVPVHWVEYFPVEKTTPIVVTNANISRPQFSSLKANQGFQNLVKRLGAYDSVCLFRRRLFAYLADGVSPEVSSELSGFLNPKSDGK